MRRPQGVNDSIQPAFSDTASWGTPILFPSPGLFFSIRFPLISYRDILCPLLFLTTPYSIREGSCYLEPWRNVPIVLFVVHVLGKERQRYRLSGLHALVSEPFHLRI